VITVDASAVLAIIMKEPDGPAFAECLAVAGGGVMSAVNFWEVMVRAEVDGGAAGRSKAEQLFHELNIVVAPADAGLAKAAADAFARYGRKTPANLNLGDCFAYALAAEQGEGLLFKGNDFPRTDVKSAI